MNREAMKLALEALGGVWKGGFSFPHVDCIRKAITALREALAEQPAQQEPEIEYCTDYHCAGDCGRPHNQKEMREFLAAEQPAQQQEPVADEVRCPECGYLTKHTEHIGCLRKQLNAINAFEQRNFAIVNMDKFPPAQRTWVGLSEEDREQHRNDWYSNIHDKEFRAIEAKLRSKNEDRN